MEFFLLDLEGHSNISAVGLICCDFEETPKEKVFNMSKLTKPNFSTLSQKGRDLSKTTLHHKSFFGNL